MQGLKGFSGIGDIFSDITNVLNAGSELVNPSEESGYDQYDQYSQYGYDQFGNPIQSLPGTYTPATVYNPATANPATATPALQTRANATTATNTKLQEWFNKNKTLVLVAGAGIIGLIIFMNMKK